MEFIGVMEYIEAYKIKIKYCLQHLQLTTKINQLNEV